MSSNNIVIATKKLTKSHIIFSNTTSQFDCIDFKKINFLFANENEITITVPNKTCASGHHITLYIFENDKQLRSLKSMPNDKSILKCSIINGVVTHFDSFDDQLSEATIELNEKVNEFWQKFVDNIESKQNRVSDIFDKYRK